MQDQWKVFNKRMIKSIRFERDGFLVDVILQNCITRDVLFGASMTKETLLETIENGVVVLYSKNRKVRWLKGETSGDFLKVVSMTLNCEKNQLLVQVLPIGEGVCHRKSRNGKAKASCFYRLVAKVNIIEVNGKYYQIRNRRQKEVKLYTGYGWLSENDIFKLRQTDYRFAP